MAKRKSERETSAGGIVFRRLASGTLEFLLIKDSYQKWGFPKGHIEPGELPADAARRETTEETGLVDLLLHGPIRIIDWHFRLRGRLIHKYCHFFLFEGREGTVRPQLDEGITAFQWLALPQAQETLSYDNARGVLKRAAEMASTLTATAGGRPPATVPPAES